MLGHLADHQTVEALGGRDDARQEIEMALFLSVVAYHREGKHLFPDIADDVWDKIKSKVKRTEPKTRSLDDEETRFIPAEAATQDAAILAGELAAEVVAADERLRAKYDGALDAGLIDVHTHHLLTLHHCDGISMRAVAARVGHPYETVKKQLFRGRRRVEGRVKQRPHGPKPRA